MNKRVKKLTIENNLKNNENSEALKNDRELTLIKNNLWSQVHSQTMLHKNQFDFIFKHKILYHTKEIFYIIVSSFIFLMFTNGSDNTLLQLVLVLVSAYGLIKLISMFNKSKYLDTTINQLYDRILVEKHIHVNALNIIDTITEFQQKTNDKIAPLYNEEEDREINDFVSKMYKKYPELKGKKDDTN